jgi:hypothetical protein
MIARTPATHVLLHVYPFYFDKPVGPKILSFETQALQVLLGHVDVDALVEEGVQAVYLMFSRIIRLLCFRMDSLGRIRLSVVGAAVLAANEAMDLEPICDADADSIVNHTNTADEHYEHSIIKIPSEEEIARRLRLQVIEQHVEANRSKAKHCTRIQALWRRALARLRVKALRLRHKSVVPIQCLARKIISRSRVRAQHQMIARVARERDLQSSAEAWVPSLLADYCPGHKVPFCTCTQHACCLQGNDVNLFCQFAEHSEAIIFVADHFDPEIVCRCQISCHELETVASALLHNQVDQDFSEFLAPNEALALMLSTSRDKEKLLATLSQGIHVFVSRQMEFIKATWDVHDVSTTFGVYLDGEDLVVGI